MDSKPAILISMPMGLTLGGVQVWAARLVNALAARGRQTGLVLHHPVGTPLDFPLDPRVRITHVPVARPLAEAGGDLSPYLPAYNWAVEKLFDATGQPVVCVPCHLGDSAGLFAALTQKDASKVRMAGWCHLDIPYDVRVLEWYAPIMSHVAAVSEHLASLLRPRLSGKVWSIPNGVEPVAAFRKPRRVGPLKIVYVGRLNRDVKRVMALVAMSDMLTRLRVAHTLTIVGDGPAAAELDAAIAGRSGIVRVPVAGPARVTKLLDEHDVFVLPSRVEGLSIAMLEAMARGCVPVVSRTDSGCGQVIDGANGLIVDIHAYADENTVGVALARAIAPMIDSLDAMSQRAICTIRERFSMSGHADVVEELIDQASAGPELVWPSDRPAAFTAHDAARGSGAVPPDGALRLRGLLDSLEGRRVVVHGTGRHSIELREILEEYKDRVVAFADDDPTRHGAEFMGLPIVHPATVCRTGASDVVISSWMNQELIWDGRATYEGQRLTVHRIYPKAA